MTTYNFNQNQSKTISHFTVSEDRKVMTVHYVDERYNYEVTFKTGGGVGKLAVAFSEAESAGKFYGANIRSNPKLNVVSL